MLRRLRHLSLYDFDSLSEEESKQANECKQRTLNILNDALKKKDSLLVGDPEVCGDEKQLRLFPLISTDLVEDLISQLQNVTFRMNNNPEKEKYTIAYVYPTSETGTIYLGKMFWELPEFLVKRSRPETLIHEVSLLLGYGHTIKSNEEKVKKSRQHKLCPVSGHCIETAFSSLMNHSGSYTNGSYSCCGETSRDTVCEKSLMSFVLSCFYDRKASLLSEEEYKSAIEAKKRVLNILNDALKKKDAILVDNPAEFSDLKKFRRFPLISTDLVKDLISQLQKVTFKRNKDPESEKCFIAYVHLTIETETIYLCKMFWEQPEFLDINSRPETLIHEVSHLLGYGHTIKENEEKVKKSQQHKLCPVSVHCIETAFSSLMNHRRSYTNGSYSCCGETSRDTLCEKSKMSSKLKYLYDRKASLLSEAKYKSANEAKERALNILHDALKKKDVLLVENPAEFSDQEKLRYFPLISTDLVKDLISQLQKVTFKTNKDPESEKDTIAYVCRTSGTGTIYLCKKFWELPEFLEMYSRPGTLIHEVSLLLGHTIKENQEKVETSQQYKLRPASVYFIETAFSSLMNHRGSYTNGSYSCCGETSRDTLCEKSSMADTLRYTHKGSERYIEPCERYMEPWEKILICREEPSHLPEDTRLFSIVEDLFQIDSITTRSLEIAVPDSSWIVFPAVAERTCQRLGNTGSERLKLIIGYKKKNIELLKILKANYRAL